MSFLCNKYAKEWIRNELGVQIEVKVHTVSSLESGQEVSHMIWTTIPHCWQVANVHKSFPNASFSSCNMIFTRRKSSRLFISHNGIHQIHIYDDGSLFFFFKKQQPRTWQNEGSNCHKNHKFTSMLWCAMFLPRVKDTVFEGNSGHIKRKCYLNWYFMTYKGSWESEGINSPQAVIAHQVHGRAPRRMWLNKQLRWRLSKVLYLCLHGLQGTESDCHNQYASKR